VPEHLAQERFCSAAQYFEQNVAAPVHRRLEEDLQQKHGAMMAVGRTP
jgi:hypothetical protein